LLISLSVEVGALSVRIAGDKDHGSCLSVADTFPFFGQLSGHKHPSASAHSASIARSTPFNCSIASNGGDISMYFAKLYPDQIKKVVTPLVLRRLRVHRMSPNVRDDGQRPSLGRDARRTAIDLPDGLNEIFFRSGLDSRLSVDRACEIGFLAK
jgi:hypothetical protein